MTAHAHEFVGGGRGAHVDATSQRHRAVGNPGYPACSSRFIRYAEQGGRMGAQLFYYPDIRARARARWC
jgi:hypothetical protein